MMRWARVIPIPRLHGAARFARTMVVNRHAGPEPEFVTINP
jgi:hypothetical protein